MGASMIKIKLRPNYIGQSRWSMLGSCIPVFMHAPWLVDTFPCLDLQTPILFPKWPIFFLLFQRICIQCSETCEKQFSVFLCSQKFLFEVSGNYKFFEKKFQQYIFLYSVNQIKERTWFINKNSTTRSSMPLENNTIYMGSSPTH